MSPRQILSIVRSLTEAQLRSLSAASGIPPSTLKQIRYESRTPGYLTLELLWRILSERPDYAETEPGIPIPGSSRAIPARRRVCGARLSS